MRAVGIELGLVESRCAVIRDGRAELIRGGDGSLSRSATSNPLFDSLDARFARISEDLRYWRDRASIQLGEEVTGAVLALPMFLDRPARRVVRSAARAAGLDVWRTLSEVQAVCVGRAWHRQAAERILLAYVSPAGCEVLAAEIGEGVVQDLSSAAHAFRDGDSADGAADRERRLAQSIGAVLTARVWTPADFDEVMLVEPAWPTSRVADLVRKITGKAPTCARSEISAIGAAVDGAVLVGQVNDLLHLKACERSFVLRCHGQDVTLIERDTTIPTKRSAVFTNVRDDQERLDLVLLERAAGEHAESIVVARSRIQLSPRPRGQCKIEVAVDIEPSSIVRLRARDLDTGREVHQRISDGEIDPTSEAFEEGDAKGALYPMVVPEE